MAGLISRVFCIVFVIAGSNGDFVNELNEPFIFNCPSGQIIEFVSSIFNNPKEDRRWEFLCRGVGSTHACSDSGYVNAFDDPVVFKCPRDQVITGVNSYHSNKHEDRRFGFQCCSVLGRQPPRDCYITDNVNELEGKLTLVVPEGKAIKGAHSHFNNKQEDRRWKFEICTL